VVVPRGGALMAKEEGVDRKRESDLNSLPSKQASGKKQPLSGELARGHAIVGQTTESGSQEHERGKKGRKRNSKKGIGEEVGCQGPQGLEFRPQM